MTSRRVGQSSVEGEENECVPSVPNNPIECIEWSKILFVEFLVSFAFLKGVKADDKPRHAARGPALKGGVHAGDASPVPLISSSSLAPASVSLC